LSPDDLAFGLRSFFGIQLKYRVTDLQAAPPAREGPTMTAYAHILDLAKEAEPPADGILSKTIYQDDQIKAVVFGFGQGQELSEHTAAKPAMLIFVKGEATVGLGDDSPGRSSRNLGPHADRPAPQHPYQDARSSCCRS
jgi:hypothetical protein